MIQTFERSQYKKSFCDGSYAGTRAGTAPYFTALTHFLSHVNLGLYAIGLC